MTGADAVDGDGQGAVYQLQQSLWLLELYTAAWMWNLNGVPHDDSSTEFYSMLESQNIGFFFSILFSKISFIFGFEMETLHPQNQALHSWAAPASTSFCFATDITIFPGVGDKA